MKRKFITHTLIHSGKQIQQVNNSNSMASPETKATKNIAQIQTRGNRQ